MRTSPRRRAREFVLQGLYQRQLSGNAPDAIRAQLSEAAGFARADAAYFDALWNGAVAEYDALVELVAPVLDRKPAELSPIERAILVIGAWELRDRPEIPYRVAINEAVELARLNEFELIERFLTRAPRSPSVRLGIGDDAALLAPLPRAYDHFARGAA